MSLRIINKNQIDKVRLVSIPGEDSCEANQLFEGMLLLIYLTQSNPIIIKIKRKK